MNLNAPVGDQHANNAVAGQGRAAFGEMHGDAGSHFATGDKAGAFDIGAGRRVTARIVQAGEGLLQHVGGRKPAATDGFGEPVDLLEAGPLGHLVLINLGRIETNAA